MKHVTALIGAQFGSEGKGLIAGHIGKEYDLAVRVGAANAGHTVYDTDGQKHVMQQIPCQVYVKPGCDVAIGPGALISEEIFVDEIETLIAWASSTGNPLPRIYVDLRANVIQSVHIGREQMSNLAARIGSTSTVAKEGIGAAQAAKVMRDETVVSARSLAISSTFSRYRELGLVKFVSAVEKDVYPYHDRILLEGTQGTGLSLITGIAPYTTSRNTTVAGLAGDAAIPPSLIDKVILVARTYPIRVAGNSGPFHYDSEETEWEDIGVDSGTERTTVTKKIRRVATFSLEQIRDAVRVNGVSEIALTFCDYLDADLYNVGGRYDTLEEFCDASTTERVYDVAESIEAMLVDEMDYWCNNRNTPSHMAHVRYLGTGPKSVIQIDTGGKIWTP